ncbi:von Willebrand factor type A domain-containing protein, partial [Hyaloscypha sp. PMI_1271]
ELYLPLLEVLVEVEVMGTIAWTKLTQTFTNRTASLVNEATYCFPLYDKSTVTDFTCSIGSDKVLKGVVKPKSQAKAEFKAAVARQRVAALLEEHTPEVFETSVGNIPAQSTVKVEICYITELKADLSGEGVLVTIPTSVAPRYGAPPISLSGSSASAFLAVPPENGLQIQIQVSSPVAINRIESRTHPVTIEMGSHGHRTTRNIRDLASSRGSLEYDPTKARATLSDRSACLGKDFVLLVQCRGGTLLASRATQEPHPKLPDHSALMVSINLRDLYTPDVVSPKSPSEIIFFADRSGSMQDKIDALKTAIGFFLKSLPNNCFFNICSFGSNHVFMWPDSRPYDQPNLDESMSYVTTNFEANMGGTELLSGLRKVVLKRNRALNTQVIILTDGEVWDSANTFDFIRSTRIAGGEKEIRFFALGIGDAVSHQLVEGIGRHGGGLAEVVSVDSRADWKGRVIRMLEAALTPSTWKIEISLDDVSILRNWNDQRCIQAPYHIPEFHAFSRSSVYFLFSQEVKTKSIKFKATATSGETVTADLPFQSLESSRTCVHLLAAKAVLNDLENGQSWMHAISQKNNGSAQAEVEDLARAEGERIGTEWSLPSKWTSFVVVDNTNLLEKTSRLYQAEMTELAELTRTR